MMVLCDLEGVLLDIPRESARHRDALSSAISDVVGLEYPTTPDRAGHTDYTLILAVLERAGMSEMLTEEAYDLITEAATLRYWTNCPEDLSAGVRSGVWATLMELQSLNWVLVAPCSGAVRDIAWFIIERAGIGEPLEIGLGTYAAYGRTRPDLIEAAREHAGGTPGISWPAENTVLVSRCCADIEAGNSAGVHTVAINCREAPADAHLPSFEDLPRVLKEWRTH